MFQGIGEGFGSPLLMKRTLAAERRPRVLSQEIKQLREAVESAEQTAVATGGQASFNVYTAAFLNDCWALRGLIIPALELAEACDPGAGAFGGNNAWQAKRLAYTDARKEWEASHDHDTK
jgi:hypothetical protein